MKVLLLFFSLSFSLTLSAQDSILNELVCRHFPNLEIEEYLTKKVVASYHSYYSLPLPPELKNLVETSDEIDMELQEAVAVYINNPINFERVVESAQKYGRKFTATRLLTADDVALIFHSFFSECFSPEFIYAIKTIRLREE